MPRPFFHRVRMFVSCVVFSSAVANAAIYNCAFDDKLGHALRLNVPDNLRVIRGILIWGNGAGGDALAQAEDPELVAFADSLGFCVLATGHWGNFSDPQAVEFRAFLGGIDYLARRCGHPELNNAPWLPIGHSNGGQMSYGLNALRPDRVIAMVVSKGGYYSTPRPQGATLHTPALLIAGETDLPQRRQAIHELFSVNRPRGALWAWVEEEGTDHAERDSNELIRPFIAECVSLRMPTDVDPRTGPVKLREISEEHGWLVSADSYKSGFAEIAAYADYRGNRRSAGWLPSQRIAMIFRAFASYHKATLETGIDGIAGPTADCGARVGYHIGYPKRPWSNLELFEGATSLGKFTPADTKLMVTCAADAPGYLAFHGVVTFADGTHRTTLPRRVFVRPTARQPIPAADRAP